MKTSLQTCLARTKLNSNSHESDPMSNNELLQHAERLERSVWRAVIEKDGAALGKLFSDDYIEVTFNGKRVVKEQIVDESPKSDEISAYAMNAAKVIELAADLLLLSYHLTIDGTYCGDEILPRDRWATSIWRKVANSWKCCFFQQSPYPENAPDGP